MQSYYQTLVFDEQRQAYESIKTALESKSAYANARCGEGAVEAYEAVLMDNPLCCLSHPWLVCNYDGRSYALQYINVREDLFFTRLEKVETEIRLAYEKSGDTSQYALYKAIFDVLSQKIEYDYDTNEDYVKLLNDGASNSKLDRFLRKHGEVFSPYGALVNKKAVCNGIAKLYQILCDRFGLPCTCVQAKCLLYYRNPPSEIADDAQCDHLLNVVEIDGQQAFVDLTNGLVTEDIPLTVYDFFAVNYDVLKKSYLLRPRDLQRFNCNGESNLYFVKNKLVFSTLGGFRRYISNYISKFSRGQIRAYYDGGKVDDGELGRVFEEVVLAHCPSSKTLSGVRCRNGFVSGAIIDG